MTGYMVGSIVHIIGCVTLPCHCIGCDVYHTGRGQCLSECNNYTNIVQYCYCVYSG